MQGGIRINRIPAIGEICGIPLTCHSFEALLKSFIDIDEEMQP
jgi:hypothetical protein